jgi:hypothetical protein
LKNAQVFIEDSQSHDDEERDDESSLSVYVPTSEYDAGVDDLLRYSAASQLANRIHTFVFQSMLIEHRPTNKYRCQHICTMINQIRVEGQRDELMKAKVHRRTKTRTSIKGQGPQFPPCSTPVLHTTTSKRRLTRHHIHIVIHVVHVMIVVHIMVHIHVVVMVVVVVVVVVHDDAGNRVRRSKLPVFS